MFDSCYSGFTTKGNAMTLHTRITDNLKAKQDSLGWSRYKLQQESKVPQSTLRDFFLPGDSINMVVLEKVCTALGVDVWLVIKEAGE